MPVIPAVIAHHRHHFCQHGSTYSQFLSSSSCSSHQVQRAFSLDHASHSSVFSIFSSKRGQSFTGMNSFSSDFNSKTSSLLYGDSEARRSYSKGKDKVKSNKKVVVINEEEMSQVIDVNSLREQLEELIKHMKDDYTKQLSIRGAAGALETLEVEYEGEVYPLQELAQVGRKNPQLAVLNLASLPDACQAVMKAIAECGMNLHPQQEGTTIYVPLPKVTREHRENLAKAAKVIFTKYKGSLQNVQNRYIKQCKSHKDFSEDLTFSVQQQIMKLTEIYISDADRLMIAKQKELLDSN